MAAEVQTGMEKQDMKRLLMKSKKEPVNCALGQGKDPTMGLLMLDKVKAPKGVEKELVKQIPDAKNTRFGTAFVDVEADPKLVIFYINKPVASMAKKLVKTLKGTGFSKVKIVLEDGTDVESASEEEEGAPPGQPGATAASAPAPTAAAASEEAPAAPAAAAEEASAAPAATADIGDLTGQLAGLLKRLSQLDAPQQAELKDLAVKARAGLKTPDGASAINDLRVALDRISPAPAAGAAPAAAMPAPATFTTARKAWLKTRENLESDIGKLQTTFASAFKDHDMAADLEAAFQTRVEKVLVGLDAELAHKLDAVTKAADPAQHATLVGEARQIIKRYEAFVASDQTLTELDANPFVKLTIQDSMTKTLAALSKALG